MKTLTNVLDAVSVCAGVAGITTSDIESWVGIVCAIISGISMTVVLVMRIISMIKSANEDKYISKEEYDKIIEELKYYTDKEDSSDD